MKLISNVDITELRNVASPRYAWKWRKPFNKTWRSLPYNLHTMTQSTRRNIHLCENSATEWQPGATCLQRYRNQMVGDMYVTAGRQFPQVDISIKQNPLHTSRVSSMSTL
jgi:hypothetical protein